MTTTDKPVARQTRLHYRTLYPEARPIVVRIGPGDVIGFREAGRREWFSLPLPDAFRWAVRRKAGIR